jgi:hypothetical protein
VASWMRGGKYYHVEETVEPVVEANELVEVA